MHARKPLTFHEISFLFATSLFLLASTYVFILPQNTPDTKVVYMICVPDSGTYHDIASGVFFTDRLPYIDSICLRNVVMLL